MGPSSSIIKVRVTDVRVAAVDMEITGQCPSDMLIGKLDKIEDLTV